MDQRFLGYYERELKHVREMTGEFARAHPKVAGRLGLDAFGCADPYVERLLEAFAFLTARIQLKLASAHGEFTEHMLDLLYPDFLAPTPSMAVMQFVPSRREGSLTSGVAVPRGTVLRSELGPDQQTACEYRTGHEVTLWPFTLMAADYRANPSEHLNLERLALPTAKASLRIVLKTFGGAKWSELALDSLPLYLRGDEVSARLYEALIGANVGLAVQSTARPSEFLEVQRGRATASLGFEENHALLPHHDRSFDGYRLLQEFFACPQRFMFVELRNMGPLIRGADSDELELIVLFDRVDPRLDGAVRADNLALFCTPAINLFPRKCDRVNLDHREVEHRVIPDRMRPWDFELHSILRVVAYGERGEIGEFSPLYAPDWDRSPDQKGMNYAVRRQPQALGTPMLEREQDPRTPYAPSQTLLSFVDGQHGQLRADIRQVGVDALCTNRALPLTLQPRGGHLEFEDHSGSPVDAVRCIAGPTPPRASPAFGDMAWRLISHLNLDFGALIRRPGEGASALRELLSLYSNRTANHNAQIAGIVGLAASPVIRPLPLPGPITFGRGLEVTVTCDDTAFAGASSFLLGAVLERFFAKFASINSFTETVLFSQQRGEVMRWPVAAGRRPTL